VKKRIIDILPHEAGDTILTLGDDKTLSWTKDRRQLIKDMTFKWNIDIHGQVGYTFDLHRTPIAYRTYYESADEAIYFQLFYGEDVFEFKTETHYTFLTSFVTNDNQLVIYSNEGIAVLDLSTLGTLKEITFSKDTQHPSLMEIKPFSDKFSSDPALIHEFLDAIYKTPDEKKVPGQLMYTGTHSPFYTFDNEGSRVIFCFYNSEGIKVHFFKDVRQEFRYDLISSFIKAGSKKQYLVWIFGNIHTGDMELNLCTFSELNDQTFSWLESIFKKPKQTPKADPTIPLERTTKTDSAIPLERTTKTDSAIPLERTTRTDPAILSNRNLFLFSLTILILISAGIYMSWSSPTSSGKNKSPIIAPKVSKKKSKHGTGTLAASAFRSAKKKRTKIV